MVPKARLAGPEFAGNDVGISTRDWPEMGHFVRVTNIICIYKFVYIQILLVPPLFVTWNKNNICYAKNCVKCIYLLENHQTSIYYLNKINLSQKNIQKYLKVNRINILKNQQIIPMFLSHIVWHHEFPFKFMIKKCSKNS